MSHSIHKEKNVITESIHFVKNGTIVSPKGFLATGMHAGFKFKRKDFGLLVSTKPANIAAVYTMNRVQAAPLAVTKKHIEQEQKVQALIVNSGNANACTGDQGKKDAYEICTLVAEHLHMPTHHVAIASTGVIGELLPMEKFPPAIKQLQPTNREEDAQAFAEALLTTDTCTKITCYKAVIDGQEIHVSGAAKGSGMIDPQMATMLGFITTDCHVEPGALKRALKEAVDETFNCITVDGDMSTNDMVAIIANGEANNRQMNEQSPAWVTFKQMILNVCTDLAKMIARDGEGATKLLEVHVRGAEGTKEARQIAKTVIGSSLVKTAIFGADPNWGRMIAAVGYSGVAIDPEKVDIQIGSTNVMTAGTPCDFSEEDVMKEMKKDTVTITIDVHMGEAEGKAWGCDLTYDYVKINASYRT